MDEAERNLSTLPNAESHFLNAVNKVAGSPPQNGSAERHGVDGAGSGPWRSSKGTARNETRRKTGAKTSPAYCARRVRHAHLDRLDPHVSRYQRAEVGAGQNPPGADGTSRSATTSEGQQNGMANRVLMARTQGLDGNETPPCGGTERGPGGNSTTECATTWLFGLLGLCRGDGERDLSADLSMTPKGA